MLRNKMIWRNKLQSLTQGSTKSIRPISSSVSMDSIPTLRTEHEWPWWKWTSATHPSKAGNRWPTSKIAPNSNPTRSTISTIWATSWREGWSSTLLSRPGISSCIIPRTPYSFLFSLLRRLTWTIQTPVRFSVSRISTLGLWITPLFSKAKIIFSKIRGRSSSTRRFTLFKVTFQKLYNTDLFALG